MKTILLAAALFATSLVSGCGAIDAVIDCHAICTRYSDCFNTTYDVAACESRCRTSSADNATYRHQADVCSTCINSISCTTTLFTCGTQCSSVVP